MLCNREATSKLPSIVTGAPKSCIVNRQIGVADSKYVVTSDPLPPGHVTRRMQYVIWPLIWAEQCIW